MLISLNLFWLIPISLALTYFIAKFEELPDRPASLLLLLLSIIGLMLPSTAYMPGYQHCTSEVKGNITETTCTAHLDDPYAYLKVVYIATLGIGVVGFAVNLIYSSISLD
ncbi:MAG: hypothetical protein ACK4SY_06790 [Pyrobaculum sp.]